MDKLNHAANEWADAATNGLQWLRNVRDGISTPKEAITAMENDIQHCRSVGKAVPDHESVLVSVDIQAIAVTFFQWWWNEGGTNTKQGFNAWAETPAGKAMLEGSVIVPVDIFEKIIELGGGAITPKQLGNLIQASKNSGEGR